MLEIVVLANVVVDPFKFSPFVRPCFPGLKSPPFGGISATACGGGKKSDDEDSKSLRFLLTKNKETPIAVKEPQAFFFVE